MIQAAVVVETAVAAAQVLIDGTATQARLERARFAAAAADLAADQAAQDALATRYRSEAAATQVRQAAEQAAVVARQGEADPISYGSTMRALKIAQAVHATATAVAEEDAALAAVVAGAVVHRAEMLAALELSTDHALDLQRAATASAVRVVAMEAAAALAGLRAS
ncbi:hypothetical protein [Nocardioides sp. 1609]|uniref:hypothetical protein n=1 Tax=Nocardioides sp. 1609 TaxID=2508327 RepID=UPI001070324E|nr:hypothetical protein [Nocardioides sp. 1609]